jgi:hypothetical protein
MGVFVIGVTWQTLVFQMPDDGTGAFPFIRHVAINDGKSATHKLALYLSSINSSILQSNKLR